MMINDEDDIETMKVAGNIVAFIVAAIIYPLVTFWFGYIDGWIAQLIVGDSLCKGLNILFQNNFFTPDKLPWLSGTLAWIAGFFKSSVKIKKELE